jgi:hypothetical protein
LDVAVQWHQWDEVWKGFIDNIGHNRDFYSVHFYDWASMDVEGQGTFRSAAQIEATLEMVEWYQQHKHGKSKPIVISEYGAIASQQRLDLDPKYIDWIGMRTYSKMLLQFLQRPHLIRKSMPFMPVKATWGNDVDGQGKVHRYPPTLINTNNPNSKNTGAQRTRALKEHGRSKNTGGKISNGLNCRRMPKGLASIPRRVIWIFRLTLMSTLRKPPQKRNSSAKV